MNIQQILMVLLVLSGSIFIYLILRDINILMIVNTSSKKGQVYRYKLKRVYKDTLLRLYKILSSFILTRISMTNLAGVLKRMYVLEEEDARVRATSLVLTDLITAVITFIASTIYFDDTLLAAIMTLMIVVYIHTKLKGDGEQFLESLENFASDMVHMYNAESKNIDRMFIRILENKDAYMYRYADQMYTYLKRAIADTTDQIAISEYNKIVASRHLRLIFNYLYITYRYGDEVSITGEQLFNRNMLAIQREIHSDLIKLKSIKDQTFGEQWFIILAVGMIPAASWYMETFFTFDGFETISRFLNSSLGYTIKVVCAVVSLITYYIYIKLMASNTALESKPDISWEEILINNSRKLRDLIDILAPKTGSIKRKRLELNISIAEGYVGVRPLYVKKIALSLIVTSIVAILLCADTYSNYRGIVTNIYSGVNKEYMDTVISLEEFPDKYKSESLTNDMIVIDIIRENEAEYLALPTVEDRIIYIEGIIRDNGIDYGLYYEIAAQRVYEKYILLDRIDPTMLTLILIATFISSYILPNIALRLKIMLNMGAIIYDEVNSCYTVAVLLINHSASNIYMMFNWLVSFASILKVRLQSCLDNLSEKEIIELEEGITYKPLSRLVECMLLAYRGVDLKSAFAGIEQRHLFQEESRRTVNKQIIAKRVSYSRALSWFALGTTFCLYILGPMLVSIVEMFKQLQL